MQLMLDFVIFVIRPVSEMLIFVHINTWNIKIGLYRRGSFRTYISLSLRVDPLRYELSISRRETEPPNLETGGRFDE